MRPQKDPAHLADAEKVGMAPAPDLFKTRAPGLRYEFCGRSRPHGERERPQNVSSLGILVGPGVVRSPSGVALSQLVPFRPLPLLASAAAPGAGRSAMNRR